MVGDFIMSVVIHLYVGNVNVIFDRLIYKAKQLEIAVFRVRF